jgi:prevent-host-death family protein
MREVGSYEAKTHLAELLDEVSRGESITISRHGTPVAIVIPVPAHKRVVPDETIAKLRRIRQRARLEGLSLKELIEEGRK